jgi:hypothetical protein
LPADLTRHLLRPAKLAALLAGLLAIVPIVSAHPKPGAHADVRISIEPDGVRMDCLMNLLFVDQVIRSRRASRDRVEHSEVEPLTTALHEYFGVTRDVAVTNLFDRPNRLLIDRVEVIPVIESVRVIEPEPETRPGFVTNPALLIPQVHVRVLYPSKSPPRSMSLQWGTFARDFVRLEGDAAPFSDVEAILTAGPRFEMVLLTREEPEYTWHAPATEPDHLAAVPPPQPVAASPRTLLPAAAGLLLVVTSLALRLQGRSLRTVRALAAAAGAISLAWAGWARFGSSPTGLRLSDSETLAIFRPLHENIYRAFDFTRDTDVFDALARSIDGPLLSTLHEQVYRSLVMQEEGGAVSRVRRLELNEARVLPDSPPDRVRIDATWIVEGVVYHWGHSHERRNEHRATFGLAPRPQGWRIIEASMTAQRRIPTPEQAAMTGQDPTIASDAQPEPVGPAPAPSWKPDK